MCFNKCLKIYVFNIPTRCGNLQYNGSIETQVIFNYTFKGALSSHFAIKKLCLFIASL